MPTHQTAACTHMAELFILGRPKHALEELGRILRASHTGIPPHHDVELAVRLRGPPSAVRKMQRAPTLSCEGSAGRDVRRFGF